MAGIISSAAFMDIGGQGLGQSLNTINSMTDVAKAIACGDTTSDLTGMCGQDTANVLAAMNNSIIRSLSPDTAAGFAGGGGSSSAGSSSASASASASSAGPQPSPTQQLAELVMMLISILTSGKGQ